MSISQLVPSKDAEEALLEELNIGGKVTKTGELVEKAMRHFPQLGPDELRRRTPSGTRWWPGRFRFDIDRLKIKGDVTSPSKGYWQITQ